MSEPKDGGPGIGRVTFKKIPRTATAEDVLVRLSELVNRYGVPEFVDLRWPAERSKVKP